MKATYCRLNKILYYTGVTPCLNSWIMIDPPLLAEDLDKYAMHGILTFLSEMERHGHYELNNDIVISYVNAPFGLSFKEYMERLFFTKEIK